MQPSHALHDIPSYVFWDLDARRSAQRARGRTLIDLGIGSPDQPIPAPVVDAIARAASDTALSGYPYFGGHPHFRAAAANFMADRFGVNVDANHEVLAVAGTKEGLAQLVLAICNPGDVVLIPEVHYPVYSRAALLGSARPVCVPFAGDGSGRLALESIEPADLARAKILIVNYPGNPTTATITLQEYASLVSFATRHALLLVSDLAYSELSFDGYRVSSALEIPGAKDVTIELHSCSKSFNMAGLRVGFATGNARAISVLDQYRANVGYGVSTLPQAGATEALNRHREFVPPIVAVYQSRRDALVRALNNGGWPVTAPVATMYLWLPVPTGFDDWGWVDALMNGPGIVVTPGMAFGAAGAGHFRISLVQPEAELVRAAALMVDVSRQNAPASV